MYVDTCLKCVFNVNSGLILQVCLRCIVDFLVHTCLLCFKVLDYFGCVIVADKVCWGGGRVNMLWLWPSLKG
jgi:hypothetical protein